jgi:hypothetical protein
MMNDNELKELLKEAERFPILQDIDPNKSPNDRDYFLYMLGYLLGLEQANSKSKWVSQASKRESHP